MSEFTNRVRNRALASNDGELRGTALACADIIDERDLEILSLRTQLAAARDAALEEAARRMEELRPYMLLRARPTVHRLIDEIRALKAPRP